jgi:hypothetical protein
MEKIRQAIKSLTDLARELVQYAGYACSSGSSTTSSGNWCCGTSVSLK